MEEWKDIPGYEGCYQASTLGRIKSVARVVSHGRTGILRKVQERILKPHTLMGGYTGVSFGGKPRSVHRLVALTWLPNPENKATVNHKNGLKHDNRLENLEWATQKENNRHAWATGLCATESRPFWRRKLSSRKVWEIRRKRSEGATLKQLAQEYKVSCQTISRICLFQAYKLTA